jgi:hypothetical protein
MSQMINDVEYIHILPFFANIYHINYTHGAFHPAFHDDKLQGGTPLLPAGGWATTGLREKTPKNAVAGGEMSD